MSRRDIVRGEYPLPPPSKCAKVLYYTWKLCSVVFSHFVMISLVVAYCILGAVTFEKLEAQYEREVKMNISQIRRNTTNSIWTMTNQRYVLMDTNWTTEAIYILKDFENAILLEMKVRGWDGNEDVERLQWTFTGALFYSIIVITTIGKCCFIVIIIIILLEMKVRGWDGNEDVERLQWTFTGALFYSIIVITTIGKCCFIVIIIIILLEMKVRGWDGNEDVEILFSTSSSSLQPSAECQLNSKCTPKFR
ncbi:hypothetical protein O0L34_g5722 [Tuta absoluta]|nr:hypothetical protein O0L34_g5722 [Tuta absoluta]